MDGITALKYARSRHADNDIARNSRQQQVLLAIRDRALRIDALSRLPSLLDVGTKTVQTDFSPAELLSLGKLASQLDADSVRTLVIGPPLVRDFRGFGGAALLMPDKPGIRRAIQQALDDSVASASP
jgi:anionic cell wall polymer biosynthesis LytR-Cps2A-Psr (LCP) family protein